MRGVGVGGGGRQVATRIEGEGGVPVGPSGKALG